MLGVGEGIQATGFPLTDQQLRPIDLPQPLLQAAAGRQRAKPQHLQVSGGVQLIKLELPVMQATGQIQRQSSQGIGQQGPVTGLQPAANRLLVGA